MLSYLEYKQWHTEELDEADTFGKSHSLHIDDYPIVEGKKGIGKALAGLMSIKKVFGKTTGTSATTIKIDGAPAIIFGHWQGKFFVATKSIFNKDAKINFSKEDIDKNHPSGPHDTLIEAFSYLQKVCPKEGIFQGDVLFTSNSKKQEQIDGKEYITFQPNTIVYSVEKDTPLGKQINSCKFGIVVHTRYNEVEAPVYVRLAGFGVSETEFKKSSDVFLIDAYHRNVSNIVPFSQTEQSAWSKAYNSAKNMNIVTLPDNIAKELMTFVNTYIRNGIIEPKSEQVAVEFSKYVEEKANKDILSKKSEKGQLTAKAKWNPVTSYIASNQTLIIKVIEARKYITELKLMLIQKLDQVSALNTFLRKRNGDFEITGNEGFVVTQTSARGVKLVNRLQFSHANFSSDIIKGFER